MTPKTCVSGPDPNDRNHRLVEILLARGFVATELAIAFDSFRIANRLAGHELFRLQIVSVEAARTLPSLGSIEVAVVPMDAASDLPAVLIATGGAEMARALRRLLPLLQRVRNAGGLAVARSDAAQGLLTAGAAETAAIHWEGRPVPEETGMVERVRMTDLQIVNGGQTTASLFHTQRRDKADLSEIFVQMKLSVIDSEQSEMVVPRISEYANTQNCVNAADFFSNHPFLRHSA